MDPWVIVDLRGNRCAVGLLALEQGRPTWNSYRGLDVYHTSETHDTVEEADLAFFRAPYKGQSWIPALRPALAKLSDEYEKIEALFEEPLDRLPDLLRGTFPSLLGKTLKEYYPEQPLLFLVDRPELENLLGHSLSKLRREKKVCFVPTGFGDLAGLALLDTKSKVMPRDGDQWLCKTKGLAEETRRYTWQKSKFRAEKIGSLPSDVKVPTWKSWGEMERVGAALFTLVWQERLRNWLESQRESMKAELDKNRQLLGHMKEIYARLAAQAAPRPVSMSV